MKTKSRILPVTMNNVSLKRGDKMVLKEINCRFDAAPARSFIIGPNGAGKSLFLRVCHGIVAPDHGTVDWAGKTDPQTRARAQAMVFQRPVLLRRSTRGNIDLALKIHGLDAGERRQRVAEALDRTGLTRLADTSARALSFGEQQRLALARAMALRPQVLFLDEPTANLDPAAAHLVEDIVRGLSEAGVKIIMTSHDLNQARRLAQEVIFLHRGRIKERAPAEAFFKGPENDLARAFLNGELLWWRRRSVYDGVDGKSADEIGIDRT
ncbi:MAG: ATP-binding cassette domain-containing protein [Rhodospirillaceae bacterium]|nr:ATP-binding cassette domain-containing protein [Rhodospirillaceae bacterium]